jgi:hypothetical protein
MNRSKVKATPTPLDKLLDESSWLLSHAESLADYGRKDEAAQELARAASCEEEVASLLDAADREAEAAVHRVSAASCHEQLGHFARAVTLLRAAMSGPIQPEYRRKIHRQLTQCLARAQKELSRV